MTPAESETARLLVTQSDPKSGTSLQKQKFVAYFVAFGPIIEATLAESQVLMHVVSSKSMSLVMRYIDSDKLIIIPVSVQTRGYVRFVHTKSQDAVLSSPSHFIQV
jgi:hypothetical protein